MSLSIDTNKIFAVLLIDGWHEVEYDSFDIDAYEYIQSPDPYDARLDYEKRGKENWDSHFHMRFEGGAEDLIPATGFMFTTKHGGVDVIMSGPLTSILAVKTP